MATVKKVNQYECDFCGKKNYSKGAMNKHEKHCTCNPNRECRMCVELNGGTTTDLIDLKSLVTEEIKECCIDICELLFPIEDYEEKYPKFKKVIEIAEKIFEQSGQCPMCTLATLRQTGIPVHESIFDYKKYREEAISSINKERNSHYSIEY